jgi:hypothetical protein
MWVEAENDAEIQTRNGRSSQMNHCLAVVLLLLLLLQDNEYHSCEQEKQLVIIIIIKLLTFEIKEMCKEMILSECKLLIK